MFQRCNDVYIHLVTVQNTYNAWIKIMFYFIDAFANRAIFSFVHTECFVNGMVFLSIAQSWLRICIAWVKYNRGAHKSL
ncbi:hypothetical protein A2973_01540 [Candidatus Gottesmanbacteria bacterium RIFCSPLOWO2_01_FULL_49_10]|uniref:Uncharacterized protein n=1 Tax=Candidatus Gottesmanbacteria bacterium RIFCSPLOWO2_01_FULL_49_10 TaxID=1798396 RepID=A0A1F6B199_9BACT|nr:MAG: hypothetical protein A2973_01540 [Candidatus Gottesmanbacteria bacterium RIFCSPLOWO2_01_FULL_49_10]